MEFPLYLKTEIQQNKEITGTLIWIYLIDSNKNLHAAQYMHPVKFILL